MSEHVTTYAIPAEFDAAVKEAVDSGRYQSEQEVMAAALKLWRLHEQLMEELRSKLQNAADQLDRGEGIDGETVVQELREKLARLKELQA